MPWAPGQSGNPEGNPKGKPWAGAIRRAIAESDREELLAIAKSLLAKAGEGDVAAIKELGDRLDGKVPQGIIGGDDDAPPIRQSLTVELIKPVG
jgi:hypothetical protein